MSIPNYTNRKAFYDRRWLDLYYDLPPEIKDWVDDRVRLLSNDDKGHHRTDPYHKAIDGLGRRSAQELVVKTLIYIVQELL